MTVSVDAPADGRSGLVRRLWRAYIRPHLPRVLAAAGLIAVAALATGALALLMEPILDDVLSGTRTGSLWLIGGGVALAFLARGASIYCQNLIMAGVSLAIVARLQREAHWALVNADMADVVRQRGGDLVSRLVNDAALIRSALVENIVGMARGVISLTVLVGVMIWQDPVLSLAAVLLLPIAAVAAKVIGGRMRKITRRGQEAAADLTSRVSQTVGALQQVKTDRGERFEHDKVTEVIERTRLLAYRSKRTDSVLPFLVEIMSGAAIMAVIVYGGAQVAAGERTLGTLFSFMTAFLMAFEPMKQIGRFNNGMQRGLAAAERLFAVIDRPRNMLDPPEPAPFPAATDIQFADVQFRYPGEDNQALSGIDLRVAPGERVALVGRSGAGKTTIFGLLLRLYDADAGAVTIGGTSVAALTQHELRGHIGVVSQNPVIFNDTVLNNLRYGRTEASDAEVVAAAEAAAADGFIRALPDGYETALGDQGLRLSGGQRQRLSIARALLKDAPILLLDEATSALDSESEQAVNTAINHLVAGRTTMVIAHRLATVIDADRIYVLDSGTVVDSGTHAELMARDGLYAVLFAAQRHAS